LKKLNRDADENYVITKETGLLRQKMSVLNRKVRDMSYYYTLNTGFRIIRFIAELYGILIQRN